MKTNPPATVDEYIAEFSPDVQTVLQQMRTVVRQSATDAQETIKYAMPTYVLHGNLVYFAAFRAHIGLYGISSNNAAFARELALYKTGKGSIQFPLDQPLPLELIARIVRLRAEENRAGQALKARSAKK